MQKAFHDSVNKKVTERTAELQAEIERIKKEYSVEEVDKLKKENEELRNRLSNNQYRRDYSQFKEKLEKREAYLNKRLKILEDFIINVLEISSEDFKSIGKSINIRQLSLTQTGNRVKKLFKDKEFLSLIQKGLLFKIYKETTQEEKYGFYESWGKALYICLHSVCDDRYYDYYE